MQLYFWLKALRNVIVYAIRCGRLQGTLNAAFLKMRATEKAQLTPPVGCA